MPEQAATQLTRACVNHCDDTAASTRNYELCGTPRTFAHTRTRTCAYSRSRSRTKIDGHTTARSSRYHGRARSSSGRAPTVRRAIVERPCYRVVILVVQRLHVPKLRSLRKRNDGLKRTINQRAKYTEICARRRYKERTARCDFTREGCGKGISRRRDRCARTEDVPWARHKGTPKMLVGAGGWRPRKVRRAGRGNWGDEREKNYCVRRLREESSESVDLDSASEGNRRVTVTPMTSSGGKTSRCASYSNLHVENLPASSSRLARPASCFR